MLTHVQIDKFVLHELSVLEMGALNDYEAFSFNKGNAVAKRKSC